MQQTEKVIRAYIALRDQKESVEAQMKAQVAEIKGQMKVLETWLLQQMNETGLDKLGAKGVGTAYLAKKEHVGVEDWDTLASFILENQDLEFLNRAVNKSAVREYMAAHDGLLPPGVKYSSEMEVNVRRS